MMHPEFWHKVYDVLEECCKAVPSDRELFVLNQSSADFPESEWRFQGNLGFGGKFHYSRSADKIYVSCYQEHQTMERIIAMKEANDRLDTLWRKRHLIHE